MNIVTIRQKKRGRTRIEYFIEDERICYESYETQEERDATWDADENTHDNIRRTEFLEYLEEGDKLNLIYED